MLPLSHFWAFYVCVAFASLEYSFSISWVSGSSVFLLKEF
jgi:hypothetical protein